MITVQVTYEDMTDALNAEIRLRELQLRSFTAVDEEVTILNVKVLCRREAAVSWYRSAGSEYR
jgi:hypothetical protein